MAGVQNVVLSFQGIGFSTGVTHSFDVMVGDNPPKITGGYANWAHIRRPLQRSLTMFNGYDPVQMTVEVRFGSWIYSTPAFTWDHSDVLAKRVESDIGLLEWMAGSNFHQGPSPVVYVWSHGSQGHDTYLIPPQYASQQGVPWIVTGLTWGQEYRNQNGFRVRQDATVVLENYLNLNAPPKSDQNVGGGYFISRGGRDTPLRIAGAPSAHSPFVDHRVLAGRICNDPKNNPCKGTNIRLKGKSLSFTIRHGVAVFVPQHQRD